MDNDRYEQDKWNDLQNPPIMMICPDKDKCKYKCLHKKQHNPEYPCVKLDACPACIPYVPEVKKPETMRDIITDSAWTTRITKTNSSVLLTDEEMLAVGNSLIDDKSVPAKDFIVALYNGISKAQHLKSVKAVFEELETKCPHHTGIDNTGEGILQKRRCYICYLTLKKKMLEGK